MKKKYYILIAIILISIITINIYSILDTIKINSKKENHKVKIQDVLSNGNSTLAIQIQNDDYTWSEAKDRTSWPDKSIYTWTGAECTDSEGAEVKSTDVLTFDETTYTATVNTKNSVYCTLFFAKGRPALEVMHKYSGTTLGGGANGTTAVFELIRYKGTASQVTNNYICFGTNNIDTCLAQPGTYMYRIIGIQASANANLGIPANSLKIIKASKYGSNVVWNGSTGATWDTASVNTSVLAAYYNSISTTNSGVNWKNLILQDHYWYIGDISSAGSSEVTTKSSTNKPIGLMYQSDYINAYKNSAEDNWLFIVNGWDGNKKENEWTMSRYGNKKAWRVTYWWEGVPSGNAELSEYDMYNVDSYTFAEEAVRPVFYLVPGIALAGEGSTTKPFIITNKA